MKNNGTSWRDYLVVGLVLIGLFLFFRETKWEQFSSIEGGFSVEFPSKPEIKRVSGRTSDSRFQNGVLFMADKGQTSYLVGYADDFDDVVEQSSIEDRLDGARDSAIAYLKGEMTSTLETKISKNGFPGREIVLQGNGVDCKCRVYIVGKRRFTLVVTGSNVRFAKDTNRFFDSFEFLAN
jgi:hypothetical protein